jgi:hypothetical protein
LFLIIKHIPQLVEHAGYILLLGGGVGLGATVLEGLPKTCTHLVACHELMQGLCARLLHSMHLVELLLQVVHLPLELLPLVFTSL